MSKQKQTGSSSGILGQRGEYCLSNISALFLPNGFSFSYTFPAAEEYVHVAEETKSKSVFLKNAKKKFNFCNLGNRFFFFVSQFGKLAEMWV